MDVEYNAKEADYALAHRHEWMKPERVHTPLVKIWAAGVPASPLVAEVAMQSGIGHHLPIPRRGELQGPTAVRVPRVADVARRPHHIPHRLQEPLYLAAVLGQQNRSWKPRPDRTADSPAGPRYEDDGSRAGSAKKGEQQREPGMGGQNRTFSCPERFDDGLTRLLGLRDREQGVDVEHAGRFVVVNRHARLSG